MGRLPRHRSSLPGATAALRQGWEQGAPGQRRQHIAGNTTWPEGRTCTAAAHACEQCGLECAATVSRWFGGHGQLPASFQLSIELCDEGVPVRIPAAGNTG